MSGCRTCYARPSVRVEMPERRGPRGSSEDAWEGPSPGEYFGAWPLEAHQVVPPVGDGQRVRALAAEANRDAAVVVVRGGDVVDAVGALRIGLEEPSALYTDMDQNPS